MPNPWDVGSARLLAALGFEALATTSQGFAWSIGKRDQTVTRDELVEHVAAVAAATPLPLNVDSERLYPDDPGGVAETVRLLADAGAAGCSIEDYDPAAGRLDDVERGRRARRRRSRREGRRHAHGALREPPLRRHRSRRHDRPPRRLPRCRRRRRVRARPHRPRADRRGGGGRRHPGERPGAADGAHRSPSSSRSASVACRSGACSRAPRTPRSLRGGRELLDEGTSTYARSRVAEDLRGQAFG